MPEPDEVIPVIEERLSIGKRDRVTGRIRIQTVTDTVEELVKADLESTSIAVKRVPVGRMVEKMPEIRVEGDVTIVPVVEEILVVERRLRLTEEIHLTRHRRIEAVEEPVQVRRQRAVVSRWPVPTPDPMEKDMMDVGSNRHLTALFDTRDAAEAAVERLRALGLSDTSIRITGGEEVTSRVENRSSGGFWESISDFFFPDDERETYAEGLRRGGYLVSVNGIPEGQFDQAVDILDDEGSVDLEARSDEWRAEGWTGAPIEAGGLSTAGDADLTAAVADERADATTRAYESDTPVPLPGTVPTGIGTGEATRRGDEEVIPVIEERLRVGKRDVNLGRVRVRSYVVEEPVSEEVSLRSDRVEIERRPVDRAIDPSEAAFTDRTIEAEEHAEEAVVQKEARVTEEIGLRKTSDERTESVSDTVRHTKVEVEDERDTLGRDPALKDV